MPSSSSLAPHAREVTALVSQGVPNRQIAVRFNVDEATVRRFRAKAGIGEPAPPDPLTADIEDREIPLFVRDYSHCDSLYLYALGDVHKGARTHKREQWRQWIDYLAHTERTAMIGTGDMLNAAILGSKSDVYDEVLSVGKAKREIRDELRPLADAGRLDLLMPGNHEDRISRAIGDCPIEDIADSLNVNYAAAAAWMVYRVGDVEYDVYLRHGTGNGQSLVTLSKGGMVAEADLYITGHTHRMAATADEIFCRREGQVGRRRRYYVSSGSWLGYESYAAQRGYPPSRIGAPRVYLSGRKHDIHCSI
jgi:predicted phosphodiesterase